MNVFFVNISKKYFRENIYHEIKVLHVMMEKAEVLIQKTHWEVNLYLLILPSSPPFLPLANEKRFLLLCKNCRF